MAIPVTRPPLKSGESKTIMFSREELVKMDDALCLYLYDGNGDVRPQVSSETAKAIKHTIEKINRHI